MILFIEGAGGDFVSICLTVTVLPWMHTRVIEAAPTHLLPATSYAAVESTSPRGTAQRPWTGRRK